MSLRPVNRIKHVVDIQGGAAIATIVKNVIVNTTDTPALAVTNDVETGSKINGIYLKVEVQATSEAALPNVYMIVAKNPGGNLTLPGPNVVGQNDNKKYVIHQEMVMVSKSVNPNPRTLFNGVIVLPRGYRRNGPNDQWTLDLLAPGISFDFCIQAHYKEFR